jgi:hypothetical protein
MKNRIPAIIRTVCTLSLAVSLCIIPAESVWGSATTPPNIWVDIWGTASYLGEDAPVNAHIQVFDQRSVQCGEQYVTTTGQISPLMPCYGDDGTYSGARKGDVLRFTINGATAQVEAVSLNGIPVPPTTPVIWDQKGSLWEVKLSARLDVSQHLLASSVNPSGLGQSVTFSTAVVGRDGRTPSGNVQFLDGDVVLGTAPLVAGQAEFTTAALTGGTHTITAAYEGDAVFYPSTASLTQAVHYPLLSLTKVATEASFNTVGKTLHYTLVATNDGNVTLTNVSISDPKLGALSCGPAQPATLAPGGTLTCTGTYVTTQADLDAGKVDNTANASGLYGTTPVAATPAPASVPAGKTPHLNLTKTATEASFGAVGTILHYTLVATNDGNVTLNGVSISDPKLSTPICNPSQPATLVPGGTLTCTGAYVTTQADVDAGKVDNTANASGSHGATQVAATPASASVPAVSSPHLSLAKTATEASFNAVGTTLHYTLIAANDGNVTLTNVSISDPKLGALSCTQPVLLAPGGKLTCTGTYVTTQTDLDAGRVTNTAQASGLYGATPVAAAPASASVPAARTSVILTSSPNPSLLGQTVTFRMTVTGVGPHGETPSGTVQFAADGVPLGGPITLNSLGQATITKADLLAGTHTITATYNGDTIFHVTTATLSQQVGNYEQQCGLTTGTYDFPASGGVRVVIVKLGTLACLQVQRTSSSHPNAKPNKPNIATGQYWVLTGTDALGQMAKGFNLTLTLPAKFVPDKESKVCRYKGTKQDWDCAKKSFDALNSTVTREKVNVLQYAWAVSCDKNCPP